ncbi:PP2C family protein-serine/threonine phosphatase [Streptomyces griseofuscus]|uniref:protein-serine/threonine phosphatase n=1 Tax=Streptomyces griseofuscus TaxID=146922 RepID=A0A7H1PSU8_9ACTN|nr:MULTISPECIES: GAF domain-containing SpoIIE family protein phosphatase [Streptomyces]MBA9049757.1 serine phosphatase RsbU (regulator of sigma subunit) [Streptomyces murinus]QNT91128.1 DNA-binding protein [Streptomyces griseofuscus]BBC91992.1 DNA-binding protein [Streptomyces rochei]
MKREPTPPAAVASEELPPEVAAARLRLLADVSRALASGLDAQESLRRLARLVVPQLADACVVDVVEGEGVRRLMVTDRDTERALRVLSGGLLPGPDDSACALAKVLRGAGPVVVTDFGEPGPGDPLRAAQWSLYRALGAHSALIVPMRVRRQGLGALTFVRRTGAPAFDEQEQALAADLGHRAALALDNARLYALQEHTAEQLQLSLLPDLTGLDHLQLATRYLAARERAEVGGDWYDAFPLPDGSAVLAIGDVVGHDLAAAVRMGQLRNMLRALAYDSGGDDPAGIMCRLDKVMQGLTSIELVTAVIARIETPDAGPWRLTWTNAGHLPPLLAQPDGHTLLLEEGHAPILGVDPSLARETATVTLPPGATLLLYTDGLVERPGEDIGRGLTRLRQHAAALAREPLAVFRDELLTRMSDVQNDDVAVLALRVP